MANYTADQQALLVYLQEECKRVEEWVAAAPGRWSTTPVADIDFQAEWDIYSIAQYQHSCAMGSYIDVYKECNGIKPRWAYAQLADKSAEEIDRMTARMLGDERAQELEWAEEDAHALNNLSNELGKDVATILRWQQQEESLLEKEEW